MIGLLLLCVLAVPSAPPMSAAPHAAAAADSPLPDRARTASQAQPQPSPREQLEEILQRPLYQRWKLRHERASAVRSGWRERLRELLFSGFDSLGRWLRDVFDAWRRWMESPGRGQSVLSIVRIAGWTALTLIVAYVVFLAYRLWIEPRASRLAGQVLSREQIREALEEGAALALTGREWLEHAGRLASTGEFRAVYRALYLALLSGLHDAGKIEYRSQRTNWTYVARFSGPDEQRRTFHDLTAMFDDVWYGLKPARGADLEHLRRTVGGLIGDPKP